MILFLTGTNPYPFDRLIIAADQFAANSNEEVIIQTGNSNYETQYAKSFHFKSRIEIINLIKDASVIVVQGGYGSIYDCLINKKKTIAIPRKKELQEASDPGDGQLEIVQKLEKENRILALYNIENLANQIISAKTFKPNFDISTELPQNIYDLIKQTQNSMEHNRKKGYNIFRNIMPLIFKNRLTEMTYFVTDKCNFKCKHCFLLDKLNVKKTTFLSLEEIKEMGTHIKSMQRVHIGGGEPMTRVDIPEITLAISNDWNTQTICLPTNGSLQTTAIATAKLFGEKSKKYLRFHFSLNMIGKEMDDFSEHKNAFKLWDKTVKTVKDITKEFSNISFTVLTTFNDYNQKQINKLINYVNQEIEPDDFSFALVRSHKDYKPDLDLKKFEEENHKVHFNSRKHSPFIRAYREIIRKKIARYYENPKYYLPCQSGKLRVVMSPEGDIFPCENLGYPEGLNQNEWYMGNIREHKYNIHKLLASEAAKKIRKKIVSSQCHCHHGVDMSLSYQSTWKFKAEVALLGLKYWIGSKIQTPAAEVK